MKRTFRAFEAAFLLLMGCFAAPAALAQTCPPPTPPAANIATHTNVSCFGGNNGLLQVVASGGRGPYTYLWSHMGASTATVSSLAAGTYTVTITDACGVTATTGATIVQPSAIVTGVGTIVHQSAPAACDGSAEVTSSGGSGAHSYVWTPSGQTAATATGLCANNYQVTVTDANSCSKLQGGITVLTVPGAPTGVTALPQDAAASVSFAPGPDNGSPITSFTVTSNPDGIVATGPSSPILVSGLANGTSYTFTVTATSAGGTSVPSDPSAPVTPVTVPDAPPDPLAQAGNTTATVTIDPPSSDGGSPITGYTVTSNPAGGVDASAGTLALTRVITGLTNGVQYDFTVVAINAVGPSAPSDPSNFVRPAFPTATITVNSLSDDVLDPGCTLRKAIENSNGELDPYPECTTGGLENTIVFSVNGIITLDSLSLFILDRSVTIVGNGPANTVISGGGTTNVFETCGCLPITVTLRGMTVTGGVPAGGFPGGGALFVDEGVTARIQDSVFTNNTQGLGGGAIVNFAGTLEIENSTFSGNSVQPGAVSFGGAILSFGTATISGSTFTGNSADLGGAIAQAGGVADGVSLIVRNSTFSGNTAYDGGGAIASLFGDAPMLLTHVTVTGNTAGPSGGGGIYNELGQVSIGGSIVAGNTSAGATPPDCASVPTGYTSLDGNVFGTTGCNVSGTTTNDFIGAPMMGALASNGGPTQTRMPDPGSPALDRATCSSLPDQRGVSRPQGALCDSGAVEIVLPGAPTTVVATGGSAQATVTFLPATAGDGPITGYTVTSDPAGGTDTNAGTAGTSHVVTGLANGTPYTFTVRASSAYGQGPASAASNSVTPMQSLFGLSVAKTGAGTGTVASAPAGVIDCGATCSANVAAGSSVTLVATAAVGSTFTGWSGDCTGTGQCTVTMNAARNVTATFAITQYTVTPAPAVGGGISPNSPQLVNHGATAVFTVTPFVGYEIDSVTGCGGSLTGSTYTTGPITANCGITATFKTVNPPRLSNIATRGLVHLGDNVLIGGFIIGGSTPKTVVIRARGPSLSQFNVPGVLANPQLTLYSGQTPIASNDNWGDASNAAAIQGSGFAPDNPQEAAILTTLDPGPYTAIVTGAGGSTGIGIVEVFEVGQVTTPLVNIATRGLVQTGDNVLIGGFIIQGDGPQTVVVRARGPSMAQFGVPNLLGNPTLTIYSGQTPIATNDNWQDAANAAAIQASGQAPTDPNEAAVLLTLQPGGYTAIVTGVGGTTGIAIVEVFRN